MTKQSQNEHESKTEQDMPGAPEIDQRVVAGMAEEKSSKESEPSTVTDDTSDEVTQTIPVKEPNKLQRLLRASWAKKKLTIPLGILVLIALIAAVPASRYAVAGLVVKKQFSVTVLDSETNKPVSEADVSLASETKRTNAEGKVQFTAKVGNKKIVVNKKYYQQAQNNALVPIAGGQNGVTYKLTATGRQVSLTIQNSITGKPLEGANVTVAGTSSKTDNKGTATLVVPATGGPFDASLSKNGFNDQKVKIVAKDDATATAAYKLTPSGKVYLLSKLSGKIDVVKTNLDGTDRQTVLAGTGREDDSATSLLASRDWKYLVLQARREGDKPKLYLINTANDKMTTMDEGDATFTSSGWAGHSFVYKVIRDKLESFQPKKESIKSYNADSDQISIIDETQAYGVKYDSKSEYFPTITLLEDEVVWTKQWTFDLAFGLDELKNTINHSSIDGKNKKVVTEYPIRSYPDARLYEPKEIIYGWYQDTKYVFYKYEDGNIAEAKDITTDSFNKAYPTFLLSPDAKKTFWSESRDGRNLLFVGDDNASQSKTIATLADFTVYGWYTDDYLLLSKKGSELYIMPVAGVADEKSLTKISDYHKPDYSYRGYGGGYGGL